MGNNAIYVQVSHKVFVICIKNRQNQIFSEMSLRDAMELPMSGVPSMRICAPNTWYVHEIPGPFLKDLTCSRKSCLVLENPVICEHN